MNKIRSQFKTYGAMLRRINLFLLDGKSKRLLLWIIPIALLLEQVWIVTNYVLGQIVNKLSGQQSVFSNTPVWLCAIYLASVYLLVDFMRYIYGQKGFVFRSYVVNKVEEQFWSAVARIELQDRENPKVQNSIDDAKRNYDSVNQIFGTQMSIFSSVATLVTSSVVLANIEWWYLLLIAGMVLPGIYLNRSRNVKNYHQQKRLNEIRRYLGELSWHIGQKETLVHNSTNYFLTLYQSIRGHFVKAKLKFDNRVNNINLISAIVRNVLMVFLYFAVFLKIGNGVLQVGILFLVFSSIQRLENNLETLLNKIVSLEQSVREANDFFAIIDMKPAIQMAEQPIFINTSAAPSIEFKDVWFKYPGTEQYVLKGVSFKIDNGEKVGLVGENGSGKTTISLLALRFYDPDKGSIRINDIDIRLIDRKQLFSMTGVVFQDFEIFQTRIAEAIRVYDTVRRDNDAVVESAKTVGIDDFIANLPNGYNHKIGRFYEEGLRLSGGQQQKVAIAGLIYRNPKLVILDEPTSDLSPTAEQKFIEQYAESSKGKTALVIFHRYKSLQLVDRIMVIEDGAILEQGTHRQLMTKEGSYAKLFRAAQLQAV